MGASRSRGLRPGGVVRAFGRLVLFVVLGFGVGLVFGIVMEEPELLAGHLRGESETVPLSALGRSAPGEPEGEGEVARDAAADRSYASAADQTRPGPSASPGTSDRESDTRVDASGQAEPALPSVAAAPPAEAPHAERPLGRGTGERRWAIQIGAFSEESAAAGLAEGLEGRFPVVILSPGESRGRWRVRVQPIGSETRARQLAETLKRDEGLPTWVTPMDGTGADR